MKLRRILIVLTLPFIASSAGIVRAYDDNARASDKAPREVRQWEVTGPWGGDVRALVASPDDSNLLFLGTSDGQIFRSMDGARTWKRLNPGLNRRGVSVDSIEIDPRNARIIYVGVWAVARDQEGGVFKTEDGGEHWKLLEGTKRFSVRSLALARSDSNLLVVGTASDDPQLNGAFRSTDAGASWTRITPAGDHEIKNVESCAIDPRDANVIYLGTWHLAWKSVDGGAHWKQSGDPVTGVIDDSDIFGITIDERHPDILYMNACSGIYRSVNAGAKWAKIPGIPFSARRTYALLAHPVHPEILFAGTSEGLWRSKDGGRRWSLLTSKSLVIRSVVVTPDKPERVVIATDDFGGRVSENLGDLFKDSNDGFIHLHILAILPDASERGRILASVYHDGSGGSVFLSKDGGTSWDPSSQGLGARDVFAFYQPPGQPNLIYAGTNTGVYKSTDQGTNWSFVGTLPEQKPVTPKKPTVRRGAQAGTASASGRFQIVAATTHASQKGGRKKTAPKSTVKRPEPPKSTLAAGNVELLSQVDDLAGFQDLEGRHGLLAATQNGLYRTIDETKGWEKVAITGFEPDGRVFAVSAHKDTPMRILAGTRRGLFVSNDGGATWDFNDRGPTDAAVKSIAQDPRDAQVIIIGTNQFVFRSTNGGRTWVRRGGGLPGGDFTSIVIN